MDKTKIAIEVFDGCADLYEEKFMDVSAYHETFNLFCEAVEPLNASIFEMACGPGNITKYLLSERPDFNILATDLSSNMLELAKANNPTAEFQLMDCRAVKEAERTFDAVMCGFCLPYISKEDTIQLIADVADVLNPNGVFYISTMENDYSKSGLVPPSSGVGPSVFIHYHEAEYLTKALEENGFAFLNLQRIDYTQADGSVIQDLVIVARKIS
jgi:predicted TPR repeat methyltransferase